MPSLVSRRAAVLRGLLAAYERLQALVLLAAGRAAREVCPQPRKLGVGVPAGNLELDEAIELLEALVAAYFRPGRPEDPVERSVSKPTTSEPQPRNAAECGTSGTSGSTTST